MIFIFGWIVAFCWVFEDIRLVERGFLMVKSWRIVVN